MNQGFRPVPIRKRADLDKRGPMSLGRVHAVLVTVQLVFSGWHIIAKLALNAGINGMALALSREVLACILMFWLARRWDGKVVLDFIHLPRFIVMGCCSFGNVVGSILALMYLSPTAFVMMQPSIPVFAMVMGWCVGVEVMSCLKFLGILLSAAGAVGVEYASSKEKDAAGNSGHQPWVGSVILVLQCLSMAGLAVSQKPMLSVYPSMTVTAWYYAVGSILTALVCPLYGVVFEDFSNIVSHPLSLVALLYIAIFGTLYAYNAYAWAIKTVSPATVTVFSTLQPVFTTILSAMFLGYRVQPLELVGGAVIVAGLLLTNHAKQQEDQGQRGMTNLKVREELRRVFDSRREESDDEAMPQFTKSNRGTAYQPV